jgi:hypothetical protein
MTLPQPLSTFKLVTPSGDEVGLRAEMHVKTTEPEAVRITSGKVDISATVNRKVSSTEALKDAYFMPSTDRKRWFIFATKGAAAEYVTARREAKASLDQALETWAGEKAETNAELNKRRGELAALENRIALAEDSFRDTDTNLSLNKARGDTADLSARIKSLKLKLEKPRPQPELGSALAIQFGAEEILERIRLVGVVGAERVRFLSVYHGLPDQSEIGLSRRLVAEIKWKR